MYVAARRIRSALLRMDLDEAGRAHAELREAVVAASRNGLTTERDRRWGRLAERMLTRCQARIVGAQKSVAEQLQSLDSERRREEAYRQPEEVHGRV